MRTHEVQEQREFDKGITGDGKLSNYISEFVTAFRRVAVRVYLVWVSSTRDQNYD